MEEQDGERELIAGPSGSRPIGRRFPDEVLLLVQHNRDSRRFKSLDVVAGLDRNAGRAGSPDEVDPDRAGSVPAGMGEAD